ncbi:MAG: rhodanese-like domain-containing protein, partial [Solirubrobacteraceae bacterium]
TRAGWAVEAEDPVVLVGPSIEAARAGAELLRAAGIWNLVGLVVADPPAWRGAGMDVRSADALAPERVVVRLEAHELTLIDVRDPAEWSDGHVERSRSLPLSELGDGRNGAGLVLEAPIAVVCASGARAAVAASILRGRGHDPVWRVSGGIEALAGAGAPMVRTQP